LPENIPNGEAFLEPLLLEYPGNPEIANLSFQQEGNQNQSAEDIQDFSHVKSPIIIDDKGTGKTNSDNTGCTNKSCLIQGVVAHWYTNSRSGNKNADSPTNIIKFPGLYKGATLEPSCPGDINFEEPPCMDDFYESLNIQLSSLNKAEDDAV
ncbi:MAG: hypothetical protein GX425_15580, partial [Peptococcaceae bacterium]|nr:hypothetical protein [Peptococcaceae bacterium]